MLDLLPSLRTEEVVLEEASERLLAEDLVARDTVPPFDNSAMDGYVVQAVDIETANEESAVTLTVTGAIACGDVPSAPLVPGTAQRIMTGAPIPVGGDAVIPHELTRFTDTEVTFFKPTRVGQNIRRAGGDMVPGDVPLKAGVRLRGPQIAVVATLGYRTVCVARRPRVALLSPGKELVEPWDTPGPGQIRNSNAYALATLVAECGGVPEVRPIVADDPGAIRDAIRSALDDGADALVSTGGVSAGDYDFVQQVVREDAQPGHVFKTSMRPGKPQVFGLFDGAPLFGLPGNPAAAIVSFTVFVRPALRKMLGEAPWIPESFPVRFAEEFPYKKGRWFMLRARVEPDFERGDFRLAAAGEQDSSFLTSLSSANAIVQLPPDRNVAGRDEVFPAYWIHPK